MKQSLRNAVVGKHRDRVDIVKLAVTVTFKACPYISDQNLNSFEDGYSFPIVFSDIPTNQKILYESM